MARAVPGRRAAARRGAAGDVSSMITPQEARAYVGTGRRVRYTSRGGETVEEGVITSANTVWVFVRYVGRNSSQATDPRDLQWVKP